MTCVVGVEHEGSAWLGSDSFYGGDEWRDALDGPKWFAHGKELVVAFAGDLRAAQLVAAMPRVRRQAGHESDLGWLVAGFASAVRAAHRAAELPKDAGFDFLLAYKGRLYVLDEGYGVRRSPRGYAAIGAADMVALGALHALAGVEPEKRLRAALAAAEAHHNHVARKFYVVKVGA